MSEPSADDVRRLIAGFEAMGCVLVEWANRALPPLIQAFGKLADDPDVALAMAKAGYRLPERHPCHCLCQKLHPDDVDVCDNEAVTSRHFESARLGPVDVPLCAPCAVAQGLGVTGRASSSH